MPTPDDNIIEVRDVTKKFGSTTVLDDLSLDVRRGERLVILGGSGAGKSTLLNMLAAETQPTKGTVKVDGKDIGCMSQNDLDSYRKTMGVLFQSGALFNSLTIAENIALPMQEHTDLEQSTIDTIVTMKLHLVGLLGHGDKMPSELSGGMKKRAGLGRALALDPKIIFYDEPSAGLDPVSVTEIDKLMVDLNETTGVTTVVITHEMTSAFRIAHRLVLMDQGKFVADGTPDEMKQSDNPLVHQFVHGKLEGPMTDRKDGDAYRRALLEESR
ncbi:MAG: ATP-binding cassette domain-containing protein [Planctomycetota bacterium]